LKITVFWDVAPCSLIIFIALKKEAVSTSETSVNFYQTMWRNIPEDIYLYTCHRDNLKFQMSFSLKAA
jgi:hypothetical protein